MTTLLIKDMPLNEEMDSNDMAAIQGGITFNATNLASVASVKLNKNPVHLTPVGGVISGGDPGSGSAGSGGDYGGGSASDGGIGDGSDDPISQF